MPFLYTLWTARDLISRSRFTPPLFYEACIPRVVYGPNAYAIVLPCRSPSRTRSVSYKFIGINDHSNPFFEASFFALNLNAVQTRLDVRTVVRVLLCGMTFTRDGHRLSSSEKRGYSGQV